jgi:hypothetical protein
MWPTDTNKSNYTLLIVFAAIAYTATVVGAIALIGSLFADSESLLMIGVWLVLGGLLGIEAWVLALLYDRLTD